MIINLNENWRIRSDSLQWILEHKSKESKVKGKFTGEPGKTWRSIGFHQDIWQALFNAVEHEVKQIEGEYPAQAQEHLLGALHDIQTMCEEGSKKFICLARENHDKKTE